MTATLTRPAWTTELEIEIFDRLVAQHTPHLALDRVEPRSPETDEEWHKFYRYRVAGAAHDLFIVQLAAKALDRFVSEPEWQLFLSRQIGDDGAHAIATHKRLQELSGQDPTEEIKLQVKWHWKYLGDLPLQSWVSFIAWELHYELHIVAILLLTSRLTRITDPESGQFAKERILPDEFVHRAGVVDWWRSKFDRATSGEKSELTEALLNIDEELQRRRNPYLRDFWHRAHEGLGFEVEGFELLYDAWRREVLAYLLNIPSAQLPKLVSIKD